MKEGGPKAALPLREIHFVHDTKRDSTIIASQARISSDASPQSATCLTQAIAEAFVAGLVASKGRMQPPPRSQARGSVAARPRPPPPHFRDHRDLTRSSGPQTSMNAA